MWTCWCVDVLQMGADMDPCKEKRKKKKVHIAGGGCEHADGPCGSVVVRACGWACRHVGMWMWMAVNKKEKRRKQTWQVEHVDESVDVQAYGWVCSRVGMRMWMAVNKKEKGKKTLTNWFRVCRWACGCVGVQACRWACRSG